MPQTASDSKKRVIEALMKIGIEPSVMYDLFVEIQSAAGRNAIVKIEGLQAKFEAFQKVVTARFSSQDEKFEAFQEVVMARFSSQDEKIEAFQKVVMARFSSQDEKIDNKFKTLEDKIVEVLEASARREKWYLALMTVLVGTIVAAGGTIVVKLLWP